MLSFAGFPLYPGCKDLLVIVLDDGATVAGVFTQNDFCAAPVTVAREHLSALNSNGSIRALVINTGCANAGTGERGIEDARTTCAETARLLGCATEQVLPFMARSCSGRAGVKLTGIIDSR